MRDLNKLRKVLNILIDTIKLSIDKITEFFSRNITESHLCHCKTFTAKPENLKLITKIQITGWVNKEIFLGIERLLIYQLGVND